MAISAVKAALETVRTHDMGELESLMSEEKRLSAILEDLLPAERVAHQDFQQRLTEVQERLAVVKVLSGRPGLPTLTPQVLTWTRRQKMPFRWMGGTRPTVHVPSLAYVPVLAGGLEMTVSWGSPNHPYGVPEVVQNAYYRALRPLGEVSGLPGAPRHISLRYTMPGAVPKEIKDLIRSEERFAPKDMAFICEVNEWKVDARGKLRERMADRLLDPILVAHENGVLWVLGSFDPTPVEQYLLNEFTH